MTAKDHLVEQHILEYESKLKHIDELIDHVDNRVDTSSTTQTDTHSKLAGIKAERGQLSEHLEELKRIRSHADEKAEPAEEISNRVGPLEIWDRVAEQLEKLVEHLDKK